jgi:tetratricopeptide (TPR) repeat protein
MRRTLNLKLFVSLLLAILVMAVGVHFLHAYQVRRSASGLLDQAAKAEEEERYADAAKLLSHYLGYVPEDTDALARYGFALDKLPPAPVVRLRTLLVFDQVLRLEPERTDVRRRLVSLAMDVERYPDAVPHLQILLEESPKNAELEELFGRCYEASNELEAKKIQKGEKTERTAPASAEEAYGLAIEHDPARIDAYAALARVLRRTDKIKDAIGVMDRMVANNPESFRARVRRALYRKDHGSLDDAEKDLAHARDQL